MTDWLTNSNASASRDAPAFWPSSQPRAVSRPDLNDPQILLLELAHGILVDTETYIDCPYRYWPVDQLPGRRSAYGDRQMALERLIDKGGSHQPPTTGGRLPVEELKR
jgi:hypothetical protein